MKDGEIIVIDKIEDASGGKPPKPYKLITDKAGNQFKIKTGKGDKLKEKWPLLKEGLAIKLSIGQFPDGKGKVWPFVSDFEVIKDMFIQKAAEKVQESAKQEKSDSIETQVAFKGAIELLVAKIIDEKAPFAKMAIIWGMAKLGGMSIVGGQVVSEPSPDALQSTPPPLDEKPSSKPSTETPSGPQTLEELKKYISEKTGIKGTTWVKSWMATKCKVTEEEFKDIPALYAKINKVMNWEIK